MAIIKSQKHYMEDYRIQELQRSPRPVTQTTRYHISTRKSKLTEKKSRKIAKRGMNQTRENGEAQTSQIQVKQQRAQSEYDWINTNCNFIKTILK